MLFNSYEFILFFLPITVAAFFILSRFGSSRQSLAFLAFASLFFYGWWNPSYLILIGLSLITNFGLGTFLQQDNLTKIRKYLFLTTGLVFNLVLLGYYKYGGFILDIYNTLYDKDYVWSNVILPLAISFFTFQQIAYLIDSAAGRVKHVNFLEYIVFVTFFPQLIAGPIVHHKEMMPQFKSISLSINRENLQVGTALFAIGLFKKAILADSIAEYVSPVYDEATHNSITFLQAWIAGVGFTLQIYFDFSGYSDMALGAARMFGIVLPMNFNSPLKASNIIDFWSRWHITLTRFLTAYIFNPLALKATRRVMTRKSNKLTEFLLTLAAPIIVTMFISGIWHGAGYQFIMWGCLHGGYLVINHGWRMLLPLFVTDKKRYERMFRPFAVLLTLFSVFIAMLFFRADSIDVGYNMALSMLGMNGISLPEGIYVHLGGLQESLSNLGVAVDATAGSDITFGIIYCVVLLIIALFFPNSLDILHDRKPALAIPDNRGTKFDWLYNNKLTGIMVWQPTRVWGITIGLALAIGIMSLQGVSVFLYWQF